MQGTTGDNTPSGEAAAVASPTISAVLAAYLADEEARLSDEPICYYSTCGWSERPGETPKEKSMDKSFKEIIDLGHEFFHGMANISGAQVAFWPTSSFKKLETISGGKLSMESRMMLLPEHCGTHLDVPRHCLPNGTDVAGSLRPATSGIIACRFVGDANGTCADLE